MTMRTYLAVDLGAESGRVIAGSYDGGRLQLEELHRFSNGGVRIGEHLYWDVLKIWQEILDGIAAGVGEYGEEICSIGIDTWGVDFGLLDRDDKLIGNPFHYRDQRTNGMLEYTFSKIPEQQIYNCTGIQFLQLNSLYQLLSMVKDQSPALTIADRFLNMPDLFNFFLTGEKINEFTISSTTQCLDIRNRRWALSLLDELSIPTEIFGDLINPGTILGELRPALADELCLPSTSVIATAGHDTASAVAAVPASLPDYIYISSGTWSLLGVEIDQPIISSESLAAEMTNEGGVGNKIRFLKNLPGLWLVQQCRNQWAHEGELYSYDDLTEMASATQPLKSLIIPGDECFMSPSNMPAAIKNYCQESNQTIPLTKGAVIRCVLESLVLEYRWVCNQIDRLMNKHYPVIHIIGGGTKNKLLNQMAANATGRHVITGPVEATAIGNMLVQGIALGDIKSLTEGRKIVNKSFNVEENEPCESALWDEAYHRFVELKDRG